MQNVDEITVCEIWTNSPPNTATKIPKYTTSYLNPSRRRFSVTKIRIILDVKKALLLLLIGGVTQTIFTVPAFWNLADWWTRKPLIQWSKGMDSEFVETSTCCLWEILELRKVRCSLWAEDTSLKRNIFALWPRGVCILWIAAKLAGEKKPARELRFFGSWPETELPFCAQKDVGKSDFFK